jgi:hypothetical protein
MSVYSVAVSARVGIAMTFLIFIRAVPGLNLDQVTGFCG